MQGKIRFLLKFYDNLRVVSRWFSPQKTLEITKIAQERSIDQTGVLCVVLHVGDLVLVLNGSDCLLANNGQSFVLIGHSRLLIYVVRMSLGVYSFSFESSVSSLCSLQKCFYFVQVIFALTDTLYGLSRPDIWNSMWTYLSQQPI